MYDLNDGVVAMEPTTANMAEMAGRLTAARARINQLERENLGFRQSPPASRIIAPPIPDQERKLAKQLHDLEKHCRNLEDEKDDLDKQLNDALARILDYHERGSAGRVIALEAVALSAMRYVKAQSGRYQRELLAAIDELEKHPCR